MSKRLEDKFSYIDFLRVLHQPNVPYVLCWVLGGISLLLQVQLVGFDSVYHSGLHTLKVTICLCSLFINWNNCFSYVHAPFQLEQGKQSLWQFDFHRKKLRQDCCLSALNQGFCFFPCFLTPLSLFCVQNTKWISKCLVCRVTQGKIRHSKLG